VENEEMALPPVVDALVKAAERGVTVKVAMAYNSSYKDNSTSAPRSAPTQRPRRRSTSTRRSSSPTNGKPSADVFIGSENFSSASLTGNRELGLIINDSAVLSSVDKTLAGDFSGGSPWTD
jgi:phosphatidylserine/phosphatidylglycerophosphate/cardiolipin synthase-like enzyme